jgi:hypothetical protein
MGHISATIKTVETDDMTVADIIDLIEADKTLAVTRRRDLASSLRTLCKMVGAADPSTVVAVPAELRERLKNAPPAERRSASRLANVKSNTLAALKHAGIPIMPGRATEPLSPDWENLKSTLKGPRPRFALSRFMSYCTARHIAPDQVDAAVFDQFRLALETQSLVDNPHDLHRIACLFWNRASKSIQQWPDCTVPVPNKSRRYALDWEAFLASLVEDVEAYLGRLGNQDIFSDDYRKSSSPKTIALRRSQLRLIATALVQSGIPIDAITDLSVLTAPANAKLALQFFYKQKDHLQLRAGLSPPCDRPPLEEAEPERQGRGEPAGGAGGGAGRIGPRPEGYPDRHDGEEPGAATAIRRYPQSRGPPPLAGPGFPRRGQAPGRRIP